MKSLRIYYQTFFVFLFSSFLIIPLNAQELNNDSKFRPYWEFGINGGPTQFYGDLWNGKVFNFSNKYGEFQYAKGLTFGRQFSPVLGLRTQAIIGSLAGEQETFGARFESEFIEFNLSATLNIANLINRDNIKKSLNLYLVVGPAITNYKTTKYELSTGNIIAQKGFGEGNGLNGREMEFSVFGGVGLNLNLGDHWGLKLETTNRMLMSDLIDLTENNRKSDVYNYTSLGLQFRFGKTKKRDEIKLDKVNDRVIEYNQPEKPVTDSLNPNKQIANQEVKKDSVIPRGENEIKQGTLKEKIEDKAVVAKQEEKNNKPPDPEYRIQIRACFKCQISKDLLGLNYHLNPQMISEDKAGEYYIYTVGSYSNYKEAESAKNKLKNDNKISDAFIVAFSKGVKLSKLPE